jgi:hypothetical protein
MTMKSPQQSRLRLLAAALLLYQRGLAPEDAAGESEELGEEGTGGGRVRCPLCGWRPGASSLWVCDDCGHPEYFYGGCGCVWNTFDTRGVCPGCGHRWRWTSCLHCAGWSLHEDWYATDSDRV